MLEHVIEHRGADRRGSLRVARAGAGVRGPERAVVAAQLHRAVLGLDELERGVQRALAERAEIEGVQQGVNGVEGGLDAVEVGPQVLRVRRRAELRELEARRRQDLGAGGGRALPALARRRRVHRVGGGEIEPEDRARDLEHVPRVEIAGSMDELMVDRRASGPGQVLDDEAAVPVLDQHVPLGDRRLVEPDVALRASTDVAAAVTEREARPRRETAAHHDGQKS